MPTARMQTGHTGTANFRCVGIPSFAVDECVGWLVQVSLTLFAVTGSARLAEGVNAKRVMCKMRNAERNGIWNGVWNGIWNECIM